MLTKLIQWISAGRVMTPNEARGMFLRFYIIAGAVVIGFYLIAALISFLVYAPDMKEIQQAIKEGQAGSMFYASRTDRYFHMVRCPNHKSVDLIATTSYEIGRLKLEPCPSCKPLEIRPAF